MGPNCFQVDIGFQTCSATMFSLLRVTLTSGNFKLVLDKKEDVLWIGSDKPSTSIEIAAHTELWGFGSGDFAQNNESWLSSIKGYCFDHLITFG